MSETAVKWHYMLSGQSEQRPANSREYLAPLEAEFEPLPHDFDGAKYQLLNPDIAEKLPNVWAATEHFIRYGRLEGRRHVHVDLDFYRALNGLTELQSEAQVAAHYDAHKSDDRFLKSGADFMRSRGVTGGGAWLERLNLAEFKALNWRWAQGAKTKMEAGDLMISEGLSKLAPMSFEDRFDAAYYRDAHPEWAKLHDQDLYKHWLFVGLEHKEAGSERARLKRFGLELDHYPRAFDWLSYAHHQRMPNPTRWSALEQFVRNKAPTVLPPLVDGQDAATFLLAAAKLFSGRVDPYAILLFQRAAALADLSGEARQTFADCLFRQENWKPASNLYVSVAQSSDENVWTIYNGAKTLLECADIAAASSLVRASAHRFRGERQFRVIAGEVVGAVFKQGETEARKLYLSDRRAEADALLTAKVQEAHDLWEELDPTGAPVPAFPGDKIVILANTDLPQCTHYRVQQKAEILKLMGAKFEIFSAQNVEAFMAALPGAAAAIFYRLPAFPPVTRAIETARKLGVPTYYEIDDLIFGQEYPDPIESYGGSVSKEEYAGLLFGVPLFRDAMRRCDYGISSTKALAQHMAPVVRTGEVFVVVNGLDSRSKKLKGGRNARLRRDDDLVVFYGSGTKAHNADFLELAGNAIIQAFTRRPNVRLMIVGFLALDERFDAFKDRITRVAFLPDAQAYWSVLAEADINLAVLKPGPVTDGKSEIKWLEAAALSIPSIVSNTATYTTMLKDGEDVLIAKSPQQWADHLDDLIRDQQRRSAIARAAKLKATAVYSLDANAKRMAEALLPAQGRRTQSKPAKGGGAPRRILIANVFFPPQTIGGATRVVRDNLDYFLDQDLSGQFEFAVATSDRAEETPYRLRIDDYKGVPVFRMSTPAERNMDWRPFNPSAGTMFGRALDSWRPDLVHFHATQRLTASALNECRRRKIPYVVTVHDAWWISDYQFLIDDRGELHDPAEVVPARFPEGVNLGDSLKRRREFRNLLGSAEAVLGVSSSFADIYRRCGIACTALPNGIKSVHTPEKRPSSTGAVRLAHVGGQSMHKGYHLVEAALRQGDFANLELTVVDHHRSGGGANFDMWGSTPVRFVGMTPQEAMDQFYAEQDVLLAPSIWPESFGLVAREALAAGLWVVASDRGAMGEDVIPGVNGWVIDVASPEAIFQVFSVLNERPSDFQKSPPPTPLRSADEQGAELLQLYDDLTKPIA